MDREAALLAAQAVETNIRRGPETAARDKGGENNHRQNSADLIPTNYPSSGKRCDSCDKSKRRRHTGEKRQATPPKGLIGTGEYEGQHRQDTGADDRQYAAYKCQ
jgi:hypothetical protein